MLALEFFRKGRMSRSTVLFLRVASVSALLVAAFLDALGVQGNLSRDLLASGGAGIALAIVAKASHLIG